MIRLEKEIHKTIQEKSPEAFDEKLNALMEEIALKNPSSERIFDSVAGHIAYVKWIEIVVEPEDVRDEFILKGTEYVCGECPFFELQKDRRIKYSVCNQGQKVWYEHKACLHLYELIKKGDVVID